MFSLAERGWKLLLQEVMGIYVKVEFLIRLTY